MPGPTNPAVAGATLPPITWTRFTDENGLLTPAALNVLQQLWAGVFGGGDNSVIARLPQPGDIKAVGGTTAQGGWLLCDGTAYPEATYPALFAAIGTTWGTAGPGTFRVPPRGVFFFAADGSHAVGSVGGSLSRTIAKANLPSYALTVTDPGHTHTVTDPGHTHTITDPGHHHADGAAAAAIAGALAGGVAPSDTGSAVTGITIDSATTGVSNDPAATGISVASGGSGTALDTTPAFAAVNWLIKT